MASKCVLLLLDGLGDRSHDSLEKQTPLQAANTPNLDRLAARGANGLFHAGRLGEALPSENAHFAIFGYAPADFPGRGALEALGAGIPLEAGDVAVLAHLVSVDNEDGALVCRRDRPDVSEEEADRLIADLQDIQSDGITLSFHRTRGLFGIIRLQGDVNPAITDSNPMGDDRPLSDVLPWRTHRRDRAATAAASALKAYLVQMHRMLEDHPVNLRRREHGLRTINALVTQRAGRLREVQPFRQRFNLRGLTISSGLIYHGLARYLGLNVEAAKDTADVGRDYAERLHSARRALANHDFVHVHTKAPDEAAHGKNPQRKKEVIEALDRAIGEAVSPLVDDPEVLLVVTSDHSTPSAGPLVHSGEPVPLLFCGEGVRIDTVNAFDEVSAGCGALGTVRGDEFMPLILNHLDLAKLRGIMDTPEDQPFWPGDYPLFNLE